MENSKGRLIDRTLEFDKAVKLSDSTIAELNSIKKDNRVQTHHGSDYKGVIDGLIKSLEEAEEIEK